MTALCGIKRASAPPLLSYGVFMTIRAKLRDEVAPGGEGASKRGRDDRPGFDPQPSAPSGFDDAQTSRRHHRRRRGPCAGQDPRSVQPHGARDRLHHRRRHLRSHRHRGGALRGAGHHAVLRDRRHRLRLCRPLLRRACRAAAGRRQHLHLYLRDARRDFRLDHRLGPHPRIRHGRLDRGGRLVGLHRVAVAQFRHHYPAPIRRRALDGGQAAGWNHGRGHRQHSRGPDRPRADRDADRRHQGIGPAQQHHGRGQAVRRGRFHPARRRLT